MIRIDKILEKVYDIASVRSAKNWFLTPVVGGMFALFTSLFIIIPVNLENQIRFPVLLTRPLNVYVSAPFFLAGIVLLVWTNVKYLLRKGTAVPVTPPMKLITDGPFRYSRNPMHTGLFLLMYGFAFYYSSMLAIFLFIPVYIYFDVRILKQIEEPELERRLGEDYIEYKKRTPMFFPKLSGKDET
jgi:protein-S-isoprenylcysteine O-methyltransferase Ste14